MEGGGEGSILETVCLCGVVCICVFVGKGERSHVNRIQYNYVIMMSSPGDMCSSLRQILFSLKGCLWQRSPFLTAHRC